MPEQMSIPVVPMLQEKEIDLINKRVARLIREKIESEITRTRWERKQGRYATLSAEEVLELSNETGVKFTTLVLKYGAGIDKVTVAAMNIMYQEQGDGLMLGPVDQR